MDAPDDATRAADPASPPALLRVLSLHTDPFVRRCVAANPSTPPELLLELLGRSPSVERGSLAEAVLENPSLPVWLLGDPLWLQQLPAPIARELVDSSNMTRAFWTGLSGHADPDVKLGLLRSAYAPRDAWARLAFDQVIGQQAWMSRQSFSVAIELACAPSLTPEGWQAMRGTWMVKHRESLQLRLQLLASPVAPPDAWTQLDLAPERLKQQGLRPRDVAIVVKHLPRDTRTIDLSLNRMGSAGAEALATWDGGESLTSLDLSGNVLDDTGAESLAAAACLRNLRSLDVWNNQIGPRGARALARSPHLTHLAELSLSTNRLGDAGVAALVEETRLGSLRSLELRGNQVSPAGVLALARSRVAGQLTRLDLSFNQVDDTSLGELASVCDCLVDLDLSTTAVSVAGLVRLLGSTRLGALRDLRLGGPGMGDGQAALRQAARPGLRLHVG